MRGWSRVICGVSLLVATTTSLAGTRAHPSRVEVRVLAEVRLDFREPLRKPRVDPVLAELVVDAVQAVLDHRASIIGREPWTLHRPFGLFFPTRSAQISRIL